MKSTTALCSSPESSRAHPPTRLTIRHPRGSGLTVLGKLISVLLVVGLIGLGAYVYLQSQQTPPPAGGAGPSATGTGGSTTGGAANQSRAGASGRLDQGLPLDLTPAQAGAPLLPPAAAYVPKDPGVIDIELSEYAGYAGLIAANGGLAPNEDSIFFRKHGFKLRIALSEEESWPALNSGKMAGSATTVDVLAVYGKAFSVVTPLQIGFSRGADGVAVLSGIKRLNALKGKTLVAVQFTESEFFLRWLAQEAGIPVGVIGDLAAGPDPEKINLVFAKDGEAAAKIFETEAKQAAPRLAGCVSWEPFLNDAVEATGGKAGLLVSNRNVLVVADVLILNRAFAEANPKIVQGLVAGTLEGNALINANDAKAIATVATAFKWKQPETHENLSKVHLSNGAENRAFFSGAIDMAGSFGSIYQSATFAYGRQFIPDPAPLERFLMSAPLDALASAGAFANQVIEIAPIRRESGVVETDPLLSKNIRFLFKVNDAALEMNNAENMANLEAIAKLTQVSPGSTILLRGHVDNGKVAEFKSQGEQTYQRMALRAVQLSKDRAAEIRRLLIERQKVDPKRIEMVGLGWEEPLGTDSDLNRRVEVQWFTLE
ncbi:hypothetical protein BH11PLA1_BH11PLA1_03560 [soil metagenome]